MRVRGRVRRRTFVLAIALATAGCGGGPTSPSTSPEFQFSLTPATVAAGASSQGTVTLTAPTPSSLRIDLSSSDAVAVVPASVVLPAGATTTSFTVTTRVVAADTMAMITATVGDERHDAALQVRSPVARPPTLDLLELDASVVRGGQNTQGTVPADGRRTGRRPLGQRSQQQRCGDRLQALVAIQAGALNATFVITTRPVSIDTQFEITASYSDQTRTVPLRVTP